MTPPDFTPDETSKMSRAQIKAHYNDRIQERAGRGEDPVTAGSMLKLLNPVLCAARFSKDPDNSPEQAAAIANAGALPADWQGCMTRMGCSGASQREAGVIFRANNSKEYPINGKAVFDALVGLCISGGQAEAGARLEIASRFPSLAQFDSVGSLPNRPKPFAPQR